MSPVVTPPPVAAAVQATSANDAQTLTAATLPTVSLVPDAESGLTTTAVHAGVGVLLSLFSNTHIRPTLTAAQAHVARAAAQAVAATATPAPGTDDDAAMTCAETEDHSDLIAHRDMQRLQAGWLPLVWLSQLKPATTTATAAGLDTLLPALGFAALRLTGLFETVTMPADEATLLGAAGAAATAAHRSHPVAAVWARRRGLFTRDTAEAYHLQLCPGALQMRLLLAGRSPSALRHPPSNTAIQLYFAEVGVVLRSIDVGPLDGETAAGAATETWVTVNTVDHVLHLLGRATPLPELDGHRVELVLRRDVPFRRPVPGKRPTCGYAEYPADRLISFEFDPVASAQLVRTRVAAAQRPAAPAPAPVPRLIEDGTSDGEGDIFERTQAEAAGAHAVPATDTDAAPLTADLQHWTPPLIAAALAEHTAVQRVDYVPGDRAGVALLTTRGSAATVVALLKQIQFGGKAAQPSGTRTDPLIKLDDVMAMRRAAIRVAAYDGAAEVLMHRIRKVRAAAGAVTPAYPPAAATAIAAAAATGSLHKRARSAAQKQRERQAALKQRQAAAKAAKHVARVRRAWERGDDPKSAKSKGMLAKAAKEAKRRARQAARAASSTPAASADGTAAGDAMTDAAAPSSTAAPAAAASSTTEADELADAFGAWGRRFVSATPGSPGSPESS